MINFEWYRTFKAIYQTGTLTGAAQELLISQPNVSQHLSALENYIGKSLFERKPRKMVPTEYGQLFYEQIIEPVDKLEKIEDAFSKACVTRCLREISIGTSREFYDTQLAARIGEIGNINLRIQFGDQKELHQMLQKKEIDFIFSCCKPDDIQITAEPILQERLIVVGSPHMDTSELKQHLKKNDLTGIEHWLLRQSWFSSCNEQTAIRKFWNQQFKKRPGIKPQYQIPDSNLVFNTMLAVEGLTIVPEYWVTERIKNKMLKEVWAGEQVEENTIYLLYNKSKVLKENTDIIKKLLQ